MDYVAASPQLEEYKTHDNADMTDLTHRPSASEKTASLSLSFFATDDEDVTGPDKYALLINAAGFADQNGFEAIWLPERHFHPFGGCFPNPSILGAAVAAITNRIGIRAGSVVAPLHHPARIAEDWSVIDNLSGGRVGISFTPGWNANDFILAPEAFETRREIMFATIETVRALWRGEERMFSQGGKKHPVRTLPRPRQRELPFWLTTTGREEGFTAAGQFGANVLTHLLGQDMADLSRKIALYRQAWQVAGHAGKGHVTVMVHTYLAPDRERALSDALGPLETYLGCSLDLSRAAATGQKPRKHLAGASAKARNAMIAAARERYLGENGMIGSPDDAINTIRRLSKSGIDEVACLIDFGVSDAQAIASLALLAKASADMRTFSNVAEHLTHAECPAEQRVGAD